MLHILFKSRKYQTLGINSVFLTFSIDLQIAPQANDGWHICRDVNDKAMIPKVIRRDNMTQVLHECTYISHKSIFKSQMRRDRYANENKTIGKQIHYY